MKTSTRFKTPYSYDRSNHQTPFKTTGDTLTVQSDAQSCDVNSIMQKYEKTGLIAHYNQNEGQYGDFSTPIDYLDACNSIIKANDMFASLPSSVRKQFDNDPHAFLEFTSNPDNDAEMIEMGIKKAPPTPPTLPKSTSSAVDQPIDLNKEEVVKT